MEDTIVLSIGPDSWLAQYTGPHKAEIEQLFGTDTIPCAFTPRASWRKVKAEIERLNPGVSVFVAVTSLNED